MTGKILLGTTLALAWADGGLSTLIAGAALGTGAYVVSKEVLGSTSTKICDAAEESMQRQIDRIKDPGQRKQAETEMAKKLKEIKKRREDDNWGTEEVSKLIALGTFAFPLAAVGVAAHLVNKARK